MTQGLKVASVGTVFAVDSDTDEDEKGEDEDEANRLVFLSSLCTLDLANYIFISWRS